MSPFKATIVACVVACSIAAVVFSSFHRQPMDGPLGDPRGDEASRSRRRSAAGPSFSPFGSSYTNIAFLNERLGNGNGSTLEEQILAGQVAELPDASRALLLQRSMINPNAPLRVTYTSPLTTNEVRRRWEMGVGPPPRVLLSERFARKYGFTNILISMAGMMAYAAMDDRAVHFPMRSPVLPRDIVDMESTEALLRPANVIIVGDEDLLFHYNKSKRTRARMLGISLGYLMDIGSHNRTVAEAALRLQRADMRRARRHQVFVHRDFFLAFPFRAAAPLDLCFYLKRLVLAKHVREAASDIMKALKKKGAASYLALHLRLEIDAEMLRAGAAAVSPAELRRFLTSDVMALATIAGVDAVYVCSGKLADPFMDVIRNTTFVIPVFVKTDLVDYKVRDNDDVSNVTSHVAAGVDSLLMKHARVAIAFRPSTFSLGALAARCPSPARHVTAADLHVGLRRATWFFSGVSALITPSPRDFGRVNRSSAVAASGDGGEPEMPFEGVFVYDFHDSGNFSRLEYVTCNRPFQWCYYREA